MAYHIQPVPAEVELPSYMQCIRWQTHCLQGTSKERSQYYNYKGFYSIVLMALVDAEYKFIWADFGATGAASDAHIYNASELKEMVEAGTLRFPAPNPLPNDYQDVSYFIIGDEAFGLKETIMKP